MLAYGEGGGGRILSEMLVCGVGGGGEECVCVCVYVHAHLRMWVHHTERVVSLSCLRAGNW